MHVAKHIAEDELTRDPDRIFRAVRGGKTIVVERQGEPRAAIVDPLDFQILHAVIGYYLNRPKVDPEAGLDDSQLAGLDAYSRLELSIAYYLAEAISLSRTAEILGRPWVELRERFLRIGIPIRTAPVDEEGARQDALVAMSTLA